MFDYMLSPDQDFQTDRVALKICDLLGGGERGGEQPGPLALRGARMLDAAPLFVLATKRPAPELRSEMLVWEISVGRSFILVRVGQRPEVSALTTIDVVLTRELNPLCFHDLSLHVSPTGLVTFLSATGVDSLLCTSDHYPIVDLRGMHAEERSDGLRLGSRMIRRAVQER